MAERERAAEAKSARTREGQAVSTGKHDDDRAAQDSW